MQTPPASGVLTRSQHRRLSMTRKLPADGNLLQQLSDAENEGNLSTGSPFRGFPISASDSSICSSQYGSPAGAMMASFADDDSVVMVDGRYQSLEEDVTPKGKMPFSSPFADLHDERDLSFQEHREGKRTLSVLNDTRESVEVNEATSRGTMIPASPLLGRTQKTPDRRMSPLASPMSTGGPRTPLKRLDSPTSAPMAISPLVPSSQSAPPKKQSASFNASTPSRPAPPIPMRGQRNVTLTHDSMINPRHCTIAPNTPSFRAASAQDGATEQRSRRRASSPMNNSPVSKLPRRATPAVKNRLGMKPSSRGGNASPLVIGKRNKIALPGMADADVEEDEEDYVRYETRGRKRRRDSIVMEDAQASDSESPSKRPRRAKRLGKGNSEPTLHGISQRGEKQETLQIMNGNEEDEENVEEAVPATKSHSSYTLSFSSLRRSGVRFGTASEKADRATERELTPFNFLFEDGPLSGQKLIKAIILSAENKHVEAVSEALVDLAVAAGEHLRHENAALGKAGGVPPVRMLAMVAAEREVASTEPFVPVSRADLFRGTTAPPKIISTFLLKYASFVLKNVLSPRVSSLCKSLEASGGQVWEIDPNRNPDESLRLNDTLQVISFATNIFTALTTEGSDQYPREMHDVLEEVKNAVESKFEGMGLRSVGGFFFLRFANPAMLDPSRLGCADGASLAEAALPISVPLSHVSVCKEHLPPNVTRVLVLVTKILQNLSNDVAFGEKEKGMDKLNTMLSDLSPKVKTFLEFLGTAAPKKDPVSAPSRSAMESAMSTLREFVVEQRSLIVSNLKELKSEDNENTGMDDAQDEATEEDLVDELSTSLETFRQKRKGALSPRRIFNAINQGQKAQRAPRRRPSMRNLKK